MRSFMHTPEQLAKSPFTPVLLVGPSGAGKQHAAEALHRYTYPPTGAESPFVDVNCAAIPSELIEGTLFGWERGAFTDARTSRRGLIEMADKGTLFLDEIAELPDHSQAKLLKFLDAQRFRRLGGEREIEVGVRVIAATNRDVDAFVKEGKFPRRPLPSLERVRAARALARRARRGDRRSRASVRRSMRAAHEKARRRALERSARQAQAVRFSRQRARAQEHHRARRDFELRQSHLAGRHRAAVARPGERRCKTSFSACRCLPDGTLPPVDQVERAYVQRVLEHMNGRRGAAAEALGISYPTFLRRLRELGIDREA